MKNNTNNTNNTNKINMNPWFITGISDGDGGFNIRILKDTSLAVGWTVRTYFEITAGLNEANFLMLNNINNFFGLIGRVEERRDNNSYVFRVTGLKNCLILKNHFDEYPLMTYKLVYYQLWCTILLIMVAGEHLNLNGLLKIIALKSLFKKGLSSKLSEAFPLVNFMPITIPVYNPQLFLMNLNWIAGFINADGTFAPGLYSSNAYNTGFAISPQIGIAQDNISLIVLNHITELLKLGKIYGSNINPTVSTLQISGINNLNTFINKFSTNSFHGAKALDYSDWCKIISLINNKQHLTLKGIKQIKTIINGMNSKRTNFTP